MAKKKANAPAAPQEVVLTLRPSQDTREAQTAPDGAENAAEAAGTILYQVSSPRGIYLRVGPGRAYQELGVLENGEEVMGCDLSRMLRTNRRPGDAAWMEVVAKAGKGWVDSAFLDRCF